MCHFCSRCVKRIIKPSSRSISSILLQELFWRYGSALQNGWFGTVKSLWFALKWPQPLGLNIQAQKRQTQLAVPQLLMVPQYLSSEFFKTVRLSWYLQTVAFNGVLDFCQLFQSFKYILENKCCTGKCFYHSRNTKWLVISTTVAQKTSLACCIPMDYGRLSQVYCERKLYAI